MKVATRVIAMIAMSGGVAGAAVAIAQVPAPQPVTTVAASEPSAADAVRQLADESLQLHAAIAAAQTQLSQLRATSVAPSASPDLAALLAQVQGQLANARQRMAVDEALVAKLHAAGQGQQPATSTPIQPKGQPTRSEAPTTSPATHQPAASTPPGTPTTRQHTYSPSPRPTNRGGDD